MSEVVIAGYVRSPFTFGRKGELASVRPDQLAAEVVKALVARTGVPPEEIEDLILGCAIPEGEQGMNVARLIGFLADLPRSVGGVTVNRLCGSSMQAIHMAAGNIALGAGEAFICAGVESMSRVPMTGFNLLPHPGLAQSYPAATISMGQTAENVANAYGITREQQEEFAVASHRKAAAAAERGDLMAEIAPIALAYGRVERDGCIRPETTRETLAGLKPAFRADGVVTAGTASPLTDGASAVLVCSASYAKKRNIAPLARLRSFAISGCEPEVMGIGPIEATRKALHRAGIRGADLDVIELNEAFASQALACIDALGLDPAKINMDGGAIAIGHPLGATGARIVGKAAALLKRTGGRYALATQCVGGGQGIASILESVA